MAKVDVVRKKPVVNPIDKVVLELTEDEAINLAAVLSRVSTGSDWDTYSIWQALSKAGIQISTEDVVFEATDIVVEFNKFDR